MDADAFVMNRRLILVAAALVGIVCGPAGPLSAQDQKALSETLSASEQAAFLKDVSEGCVENQRIAPENKGVSAAAIDAYCLCTAQRMMTRFTAAEIETIVDGVTPQLQTEIDQIEKACVPKAR